MCAGHQWQRISDGDEVSASIAGMAASAYRHKQHLGKISMRAATWARIGISSNKHQRNNNVAARNGENEGMA